MDRGWYLRLAAVVGVCTLAAYLLFPSYYFHARATPEQREDHEKFCAAMPRWLSCKKFNLGLDLQGGVHLVMGVKVDKAVEQRADRLAESLREALGEEKLGFDKVERPRGTAEILVTLTSETDVGAFEKYMRKDFRVLEVVGRKEGVFTYEIVEDEADYIRKSAVEQALKVIRNRTDKLGVSEPTIARRGQDNILIQLPGVKDPERAIDIIGRTAQLEFIIVDAEGTEVFDQVSVSDLPAGVVRSETSHNGPNNTSVREVYFELPPGRSKELREVLEPNLPSGRTLAFGPLGSAQTDKSGKPTKLRTYLLWPEPDKRMTGEYLTNARWQQNPEFPLQYEVLMEFDPKGAKQFAKLTETYARYKMAVVLEEQVNSAPVIEGRIGGGHARITLGSTDPRQQRLEAETLSLVLKAGALPAPVEIREKRQVGRSLGEESVAKGTTAIAVGAVLVVLFMLVYYRLSGVVANVALVLNIFLVMAVLALFEATLTLPGMAGIVLTIGMAVDANVIIFERIREELTLGKTPRAAVEAGYGKAFSTIFDANVTTLIAGVVLMQYGTGPVRGFAVTLIVGILCSMFTAIVVTRVIYDFFTTRRRLQSLSI